jgi:hypothetical protein
MKRRPITQAPDIAVTLTRWSYGTRPDDYHAEFNETFYHDERGDWVSFADVKELLKKYNIEIKP